MLAVNAVLLLYSKVFFSVFVFVLLDILFLFCRFVEFQFMFLEFITNTCPCNIRIFLKLLKMKIFIRKFLIFYLFGAKIRKIGLPLHTPILLCKKGV